MAAMSAAQSPDAAIAIAAYDATWPLQFARERARLAPALREWIAGPIEHVGSTAVPGLAAKPIIDIMIAVRSLDTSRGAVHALASHGYLYAPYRAEVMHWFCKPSPAFRTHHLHLVPLGSPLWRERLLFRDYLRRHPATADEYAVLKRHLATVHPGDREAYTDAKGPFIRAVLEHAGGRAG